MEEFLENKLLVLGLVFLGGALLSHAEETQYRHRMTMITPSTQWREALPSGNGVVGAMAYGSVNEERVERMQTATVR